MRAIGSDLHMDYTAVGQTTHLAARMEQMAKPGSALITGGTLSWRRATSKSDRSARSPSRGWKRPTPVYELTGVGRPRSRLQASAAARGLTRFVGRESELEQLRRPLSAPLPATGRWSPSSVSRASGSRGSSGSLRARTAPTAGWCSKAGSVSYGKATPYLPVIDLLKAYFRIQERDDPRAIRETRGG